jgi:hypothetical protein
MPCGQPQGKCILKKLRGEPSYANPINFGAFSDCAKRGTEFRVCGFGFSAYAPRAASTIPPRTNGSAR